MSKRPRAREAGAALPPAWTRVLASEVQGQLPGLRQLLSLLPACRVVLGCWAPQEKVHTWATPDSGPGLLIHSHNLLVVKKQNQPQTVAADLLLPGALPFSPGEQALFPHQGALWTEQVTRRGRVRAGSSWRPGWPEQSGHGGSTGSRQDDQSLLRTPTRGQSPEEQCWWRTPSTGSAGAQRPVAELGQPGRTGPMGQRQGGGGRDWGCRRRVGRAASGGLWFGRLTVQDPRGWGLALVVV